MLNETNLDLHHQILDQAESMRPLPQAVLDLARTVSDPGAGLDNVAATLRSDPVLTAVVLREANSAFVGAIEAASTVEQAVVRLGGARVLAIAVTNSLPSEINQALPGYGIYEGGLHAHAVATSHITDVVRMLSPLKPPPALVTAGLLHDIGKLLLARLLRPQLIPDALQQEGIDITAAERTLLDLDHAEVGAALAAHWKLPDEIVRAILFHHRPDEGDELAAGVALSDRLAHRILHDEEPGGVGSVEADLAVDLNLADALGIDLDRATAKAEERLERAGLLPMWNEEA
ncbi:MAG: HDOD domain-containing protein [Acidimicrobiales bacterium]